MKKISTVLSILALVLIGILYYLHFTKGKELKSPVVAEAKNPQTKFNIAYFHVDSLQNHYQEFKDAFEKIKKKENSMNAELSNMNNTYQRRIKEWQDKGANMTQAEQAAAQQEYDLMQRRFQDRKMELEQQLQKDQLDLMSELRKKIEDFLKDYNKNETYSYIISYDPGIIYYGDSMYDITSDVIKGLNALYEKEEKNSKKK